MDRDELWRNIDEQRASLADLLDDLNPKEWEQPSLCAEWRVQDVAAHLTLAQMGVLPAVTAFARARGSFNRMIRDTALVQSAVVPREEYAARLRAMVGSRRKAPGVTDVEPLIDVLVHGQDIAIALERPRPMPVAGAAAAATRSWSRALPFRARRRFRGLRLSASDIDWQVGEGPLIEGPMAALLLVVTGRPAGLAQLTGPGAHEARRRFSTDVSVDA